MRSSSHAHIALTGHRPPKLDGYDLATPFYRRLRAKLDKTIYDLLDTHGLLTLHSGLALGADTVWSQAIIDAREAHPDRIRFVAEVPFAGQADRWAADDRRVWMHHFRAADETNVYGDGFSVRNIWNRNQAMVRAADGLIAVWDGRPGGGTAGTVAHAGRLDVPVLRIDPDEIRAEIA